MNVHRMRISVRPAKNAAVPLAFCLRAKKRSVFWGPMMMVRPIRKRICEWGLELLCFWGVGGGVHFPWQAYVVLVAVY